MALDLSAKGSPSMGGGLGGPPSRPPSSNPSLCSDGGGYEDRSLSDADLDRSLGSDAGLGESLTPPPAKRHACEAAVRQPGKGAARLPGGSPAPPFGLSGGLPHGLPHGLTGARMSSLGLDLEGSGGLGGGGGGSGGGGSGEGALPASMRPFKMYPFESAAAGMFSQMTGLGASAGMFSPLGGAAGMPTALMDGGLGGGLSSSPITQYLQQKKWRMDSRASATSTTAATTTAPSHHNHNHSGMGGARANPAVTMGPDHDRDPDHDHNGPSASSSSMTSQGSASPTGSVSPTANTGASSTTTTTSSSLTDHHHHHHAQGGSGTTPGGYPQGHDHGQFGSDAAMMKAEELAKVMAACSSPSSAAAAAMCFSSASSMFAQSQALQAGCAGDGLGMPTAEERKDPSYWERRRKNNEAAKRSRDARRMKEEEIALRAAFLEQENLKLRAQVAILKNETTKLHYMLYNRL